MPVVTRTEDLNNESAARGRSEGEDITRLSAASFARLATFVQFESQTISEHADTALQQIYRRLAALDREVQRLGKMIGTPFEVALDMRSGCAVKTGSELALRPDGDRIETSCAEGVTSAA